MVQDLRPHTSHWGTFSAEVQNGVITAVRPYARDTDPSPLLQNFKDSVRHQTRIAQPMVRAGWLDRGPGPDARRGAEPFVPVAWETVTELLAAELRRVVDTDGPQAIFGGSYGWSSAGRFHHAQSQLHRFLNLLGGYTRSVNSYSLGASAVILPHVVGTHNDLMQRATAWPVIVATTQLMVCFGGIPLKNAAVENGGLSRHAVRDHLRAAADRGIDFVLFSPVRDDLPEFLPVEWHPVVPGTDTAVMLGLAHTLITEGLHDRAFLDRYCVGFDRFERYVLGLDDGVAKTPEWAAQLSGIAADALRTLARRMAGSRTLLTVSWSLQRADHGEQVPWMGLTLAAMLGQIGLPGGGFGFGYGSVQRVGAPSVRGTARAAAGAEPRRRVHSGGPDLGHAAASRGDVRLRRPSADIPAYPAGVLVRRQSVPPSPGPRPPAPCARARGHDRRARSVLDVDGAARGHRAPLDDDAGAQ